MTALALLESRMAGMGDVCLGPRTKLKCLVYACASLASVISAAVPATQWLTVPHGISDPMLHTPHGCCPKLQLECNEMGSCQLSAMVPYVYLGSFALCTALPTVLGFSSNVHDAT